MQSITLPYPVNLGTWLSYNSTNSEQLDLQRKNLIFTGVKTSVKGLDTTFIYSDYIAKAEDYISSLSEKISVVDTATILEDEVFYTSKIEGSDTTRKRTHELHNGKPIKEDNAFSELMVLNGFKAVEYLNSRSNEIDDDSLIEMWNILTEGCRDNASLMGEKYRIGAVGVGSHEGADFHELDELMKGWIEFYNNDELKDHPFIKASILHYTFENIHPFCDGNGRAGRLLMNNFLIKSGINSAKAVSPSMVISRSGNLYGLALSESENIYNDCTPFLNYMSDVFQKTYEAAYEAQKVGEIGIDLINEKIRNCANMYKLLHVYDQTLDQSLSSEVRLQAERMYHGIIQEFEQTGYGKEFIKNYIQRIDTESAIPIQRVDDGEFLALKYELRKQTT